jgi:transcriptional regulator with XRE-family HTH domain
LPVDAFSDIDDIMNDIYSVAARARLLADLSQRELAARAGTSQPAVARLESGAADPRVSTLERLVAAAGFDLRVELVPRAGADPVIEAYKRDVDRTLLRDNLSRSVEARLRGLDGSLAAVEELRHAVRATRGRATRRRR